MGEGAPAPPYTASPQGTLGCRRHTPLLQPDTCQGRGGWLRAGLGNDVDRIEQVASLPETKKLIVAKALVNAKDNLVPVRIANVTDEPVKLDKGHTIALLHPVEPLSEQSGGELGEKSSTQTVAPDHLKGLVYDMADDLTDVERKRVEKIESSSNG